MKTNCHPIIEALLFAAGDEGLSAEQMATVLEISKHDARDMVKEMQEKYESEERGIQIVEIAGAYQLATKKELAAYLQKLVAVPTIHALSQAALETLAIIAYKQPITRMEIEEIRGVKVDGPLQKLMMRVLIKEVGRADQIGRPILYGTTSEFLDYFGLKSLDELPDLTSLHEGDINEEETDLFNFRFQELNQEMEMTPNGNPQN